jgi:hypothetical protein
MPIEETYHLALRVPLVTKVNGVTINTVMAHDEVVMSKGIAVFAKFGARIGSHIIETLDSQIHEGRETLLFIVGKKNGEFLGYCARLCAIHQGQLPKNRAGFVPAYYAALDEPANLWFVIDRAFHSCDLEPLRLRSNKRPLLAVINETRTVAMVIEMSAAPTSTAPA